MFWNRKAPSYETLYFEALQDMNGAVEDVQRLELRVLALTAGVDVLIEKYNGKKSIKKVVGDLAFLSSLAKEEVKLLNWKAPEELDGIALDS